MGLIHKTWFRRTLVGFAGLFGVLAVAQAFLGTQPWPASEMLLTEDVSCSISGQLLDNELEPIIVRANTSVIAEGEVGKWDHDFTTRVGIGGKNSTADQRKVDLIFSFRQMDFSFLPSARATAYDGKTNLLVMNDGERLKFRHSALAPEEPGTYRLQVLAYEGNPALRAKMSPEDVYKPLGVLAEGLVVVE